MPTKSATRTLADDPADQVDQSELLDLLGYNIRRAYLVVQSTFDAQMEQHELRQADFAVLSTLRHNPGINQKTLADALAIAPPNMATLLDRLESRGLLTRTRSIDDKRVQHVSLTPQGTRLYGQALKSARKADETAVRMLSGSGREQLKSLLSKLFTC